MHENIWNSVINILKCSEPRCAVRLDYSFISCTAYCLVLVSPGHAAVKYSSFKVCKYYKVQTIFRISSVWSQLFVWCQLMKILKFSYFWEVDIYNNRSGSDFYIYFLPSRVGYSVGPKSLSWLKWSDINWNSFQMI